MDEKGLEVVPGPTQLDAQDAPTLTPYTAEQLRRAGETWALARNSSGYAEASTWAMQHGARMIAEIHRLRMAFRLNMLRHASVSHAEIDAFLNGDGDGTSSTKASSGMKNQ